MKQLFYLLIVLVFFACNDKKEQTETAEKAEKVYDMYTPSEMANLMNEMYAYNQQLKQDIIMVKYQQNFLRSF